MTANVEVGQVISRYRIAAKLGEGGMGVVWKAHDIELGRPVALKALPADTASDESHRARFLQEARSASALNHPNIITIHDIVHQGGATYLVMEFVDGKPLAQLIPKKGMRWNDALKYAVQIADALAATHKIGIVHRDLKPGNVMVTPAGAVKVLDFGLAKLVEPAIAENDPTRTGRALTEKGIIAGTLNYMSPEQAEGKAVDTRSDIFSLGAVLYEMISGRRPFQRGTRISTLAALINEEPEPLAAVPPELSKLISRCLRKDPERRVQHVGDVKLALADLTEELESEKLARPPAPSPGGRKWRWPAAAGVLAAFIATGGYLFWRPPARETPPMRPIPLTSSPGSETEPSLSPDGNQVAFSWNGDGLDNADIYVKPVSGGRPLRLTTNPARDYAPSWSPDGSQIAFFRADRSGGAAKSLILVPPLGGPERKLTEVSSILTDTEPGLAWAPDSKSLSFSDSASGYAMPFSIFQISLVSSERKRLTATPAGIYGDIRASFSPDGRYLAFARFPNSSIAGLFLLTLGSAEEPKLLCSSNAAIENIAWASSSSEIVYSSGGALFRYKLRDPSRGPEALPGIDGPAKNPTLSASGRLAYERSDIDTNIWSLNLTEVAAKPIQVVASTRLDGSPHLSRDGSRLAFSSNRSGNGEIWVAASNGANAERLTFLDGNSHSPKWSSDGRQIAFSSLANGNRDIYTIDSSGGSLRRLTTDPAEQGRPNWSRDGQWLYFYSKSSGPMQIWKMPSNGGAPVQVTTTGGHSEEESPDGENLFYSYAHEMVHGIFRRPLAGGPEILVLKQALPGWWAATAQGIYFAEIGGLAAVVSPPIPIQFWNYRTKKISQVFTIEKSIQTAGIGLSASSDGKMLVWSQVDHQQSDLMLVEGFR